jgi:hypothetical protein
VIALVAVGILMIWIFFSLNNETISIKELKRAESTKNADAISKTEIVYDRVSKPDNFQVIDEVIEEDIYLAQGNTFEMPFITEVYTTNAWAEVKIKSSSGGRFFWEFSDGSILSDEVTFNEAYGLVGMMLANLQPNATYTVRPVLDVGGICYYGEWVSFTTK